MNPVLISQSQFQQNKTEELSSRAVFQQLSASRKNKKPKTIKPKATNSDL